VKGRFVSTDVADEASCNQLAAATSSSSAASTSGE